MNTRRLSFNINIEDRYKDLAGLLVIAVLSGLFYWFGLVKEGLVFDYYRYIHMDGRYFLPGHLQPLYRLITSFAALAVLYLMAWFLARRLKGRLPWLIIAAGTLAFGLILLFQDPFGTNDIFDNISHGRILGIYHSNPFKLVSNDFPADVFTPYVGWPASPSAYGPLWEDMAGKVASMAGGGIVQNIIAFKLLPSFFLLGSIIMVALILRQKKPEYALAGTLLIAWNPVMLYETWGQGHNDIAMMFWVLVAIWALINRHYTATIIALVTGALIKFIPALLLPAAGLIILRELPSWKARLRFLLVTGALSLALILVAYYPFWDGPSTLTIDRRAHMYTASLPSIVVALLMRKVGWVKASSEVSMYFTIAIAAFALIMGLVAMRNRKWDSLATSGSLTLAFYILVACLWYQNWYTLWLLALAPLTESKPLRNLAVLFTLTGLTKNFISGPLLYWGILKVKDPWFTIDFAVMVMGLAWLYSTFEIGRYSLKQVKAWRLKPILQPAPKILPATGGEEIDIELEPEKVIIE